MVGGEKWRKVIKQRAAATGNPTVVSSSRNAVEKEERESQFGVGKRLLRRSEVARSNLLPGEIEASAHHPGREHLYQVSGQNKNDEFKGGGISTIMPATNKTMASIKLNMK